MGLGRVRNTLITLLLAFLVIHVAWQTVKSMVAPVGIALVVVFLLLMLYRFVFRG